MDKTQDMTRSFIKDAVKYLPAQITPGIIGFISIPIITRLFLPKDYGNYSLVMATVMVLTTLVGWLPMSIIRFYPAYERDKKLDLFSTNIIKLTLLSALAVSVLFLIGLVCFKTYISSELYWLMFIGIGVFIAMAVFNVFQHFLRSKRYVSWYSGFAIWRSAVGFGVGLGLILLFKMGIEGLLWGIILCLVVIFPLAWRKAIDRTSVMFSKVNLPFAKEMARYSFPLVVGNLAAWILSLSDRYILEFFRGTQEVGIYSASYNISEKSILLLTGLFGLASGPIAMHIWEREGEEKSADFVSKITRYYLIACIPAVIGLSALSKPLMKVMTGAQYFYGYRIILFVTAGVLLYGLQQKFQSGFLFHKKTGYITFSIVASGLLNLLLNFIFIPRYGYFAAAITTLISYSFLLFLMIIFSRRFFIWKFPFKSLIKVALAAAIMGVVVYYVSNSLAFSVLIKLVLSILLGIFIYFLLLFLLQEFQASEKNEIKRFLRISA